MIGISSVVGAIAADTEEYALTAPMYLRPNRLASLNICGSIAITRGSTQIILDAPRRPTSRCDAMLSGRHESVAGGQQFGHLSFAIFPF